MPFTSSKLNKYVDVIWFALRLSKTSETTPRQPTTSESNKSLISDQKPEQPITVDDISSPLFALIIGINKYKSVWVPTLRSAVSDADSIQNYLTKRLNVPESRIRNLRDEQATRTAIISELADLETHPEIKPGDPILIYYAGHGGEADPPKDWEAGGADSKIQMLVPYDYCKIDGREVNVIPDRTIAALVNRLAKAKGDNITIIFDCCHSGSGSRDEGPKSDQRVRGFEMSGIIPPELDETIWGSPRDRGVKISMGFLQSDLRSHVLLAACGAKEKAMEGQERGAFTGALLDVLRTTRADTVTYASLLQRMHALPQQNPQCEGVNQGRILFNAKAPSMGRVLYKVHREGDKYTLDAGAVHGIPKGAIFAVYQEPDSPHKASPLGTLVVQEMDVFTTTARAENDFAFPLSGTGYALQTKAGEEEDLRIHVERHDKLTPIFEALGQEMSPTGSHRTISPVEKDTAELDVSLDGDQVVFKIMNPLVTQFGLNQMPFRVEPTSNDVFPVLRAASHYHWHLRRNNTSHDLQGLIEVLFTRVVKSGEYHDYGPKQIVKPVEGNLNHAGIIDLVIDPRDMYGIKIVNNSDLDLYPYLFYFDTSDLSITSYYEPPTSAQKLDVPLRAKTNGRAGSLTIGYGSGGAVPFSYFLRDGQDIDVGFFKLFLATQPVPDYSNIPQPSAFDLDGRAKFGDAPRSPSIWHTILITVVQRRAP